MSDKQNISIFQVLPYFSSLIIFLGAIKLTIFYNHFGINIINYIEFSEIIVSFLNITIFNIAIFLFYSIPFIFLFFDNTSNGDLFEEKVIKEPKFINRVKEYLSFNYRFLTIMVVFCVVSSLFFNIISIIYGKFKYSNITYPVGLIIFFYTLVIVYNEIITQLKKKSHSAKTSKVITSSYLIAILIVIATIIYSYDDAKSLKRKKITFGTTIIFKDNQKFVSDSFNYFIGKTNNYIFIHHEKSKATDVIPVSQIIQLTISKK